MELGRASAGVTGPTGDGGTPASYGGGGAGGRLELEDIAKGVPGLVLDGDDGPMGVVEKVIGNLWNHGLGSMQARWCLQPARRRGRTRRKREALRERRKMAVKEKTARVGTHDETRLINLTPVPGCQRPLSLPLPRVPSATLSASFRSPDLCKHFVNSLATTCTATGIQRQNILRCRPAIAFALTAPSFRSIYTRSKSLVRSSQLVHRCVHRFTL